MPMPNASEPSDEELLAAARAAREHAYAPYSSFAVGAALLCEDGTLVTACNVENASYGLSLCAERSAVAAAVAAGKRRFTTLAVVGGAEGASAPCGACRQFLFEFAPALRVLYSEGAGYEQTTLHELLPAAFELP
jgi:cytidine deaminase